MRKNSLPMRKNSLLITVAAASLMAGATLVSAQAPSGRDSSGAGGSSGSQTQSQGSPSGSGSSSQGGQMQKSPSSSEKSQPGTTGQSSPSEHQGGQSGQTQQRQGSGERGQQGTSGQASPSERQGGQSGQTQQRQGTGSETQRQQSGQSGTSTQQSQSAPGGGAASANITTEQRTRIRQTVMSTSNAPRVSKVDFSVSVGTAVPRTVHLVPVPTTIVEIQPAWRGYMYFIVGEQIVIVEPDTHKIIAVIAA